MQQLKQLSTRLLSFVLAFCMCFSLLSLTAEQPAEAYNSDNAPAATVDQLTATARSYAFADEGAGFRIVDGELWIWGPNRQLDLGIDSFQGASVDTETIVLAPMKHPYEFDGKLLQVIASWGATLVVTDQGSVYSWGKNCYWGGSTLPQKLDTSAIDADGGVDYLEGGNVGVVAHSKNGKIFFIGGAEYLLNGHTGATTISKKFVPFATTWEDKFQASYQAAYKSGGGVVPADFTLPANERVGGANRRSIVDLHIEGGNWNANWVTSERTADGGTKLMCWSTNSGSKSSFNGNINRQTAPIDLNDVPENAEMMASEPRWETLAQCTGSSAVIDMDGSVWACGAWPYTNNGFATKVFDRRETQVKALKAVVSNSLIIIIGEDNSLWAAGQNLNKFIDPAGGASDYYRNAKLTFAEQSLKQTITGTYVCNNGVIVLTKSGEQYFAGNNWNGTAGTGELGGFEEGTIGEASATTIPPVEPMTANRIYFTIESEDGVYEKQSDGSILRTYKDGNATKTQTLADPVNLRAGATFKLHVYFEDLALMNGFVLPIRFDPQYIRVVNGSGKQYPEGEISTPGAIGTSMGIERKFTSREWSGGFLFSEGETSGEYPKICNSGGWVSVAGYSYDSKAKIEGKVEMFTIAFTVIKTTIAPTAFTLATESNANQFVTANVGVDKFDRTALETLDHGGGFTVSNRTAGGRQGEFTFNEVSESGGFPQINARVILVDSLTLSIKKSDGSIPQKEESGINIKPDGEASPTGYKGWVIPSANTAETYVITSTPNPTDASFPAVDWSVSLLAVDGSQTKADGTNYALSDFFGLTDPQDRTFRFKLSDNINPDKIAAIKVVAYTKENGTGNQKKHEELTLIIKSLEAPSQIRIKQKVDLPDAIMIYTATDPGYLNNASVITKFEAEFPMASNDFSNTAVVWRLFDSYGNEVDASTANAPAYLTGVTGATGKPSQEAQGKWTPPSVTVVPVHSTMGSTYLTLRLESAYDSSVNDSITIKVHLKATSMNFKQVLLRLPTMASKDLNDLLEIGPENDVWDTNLVWTYEGVCSDADNSVVSTTNNVIILSNAGVVTADVDPTGEGVHERVKVTDTISGKSATIKVKVLALDSPIKPADVKVYNVVGSKGDYAVVKGIKAGDIITFYETYMPDVKYDPTKPATEQSTAYKNALKAKQIQQYGPLSAEQAKTGSYEFSLQDFLDAGGGEIGMSVSRAQGGDVDPTLMKEFDQIPVSYETEPSKVYGYISLAGKSSTTARKDKIAVQLTGPSNPDIVYTDANGYFEFKTYIRPGSYTLSIYQDNYLKRIIQADSATGYQGIVIPAVEEFAISTDRNPIELYPGDLNADGAINATDMNQYIRSWLGKTAAGQDMSLFSHYDFFDSAYEVIDLNDLDVMARHNGWTRESYPNWNIPTVR